MAVGRATVAAVVGFLFSLLALCLYATFILAGINLYQLSTILALTASVNLVVSLLAVYGTLFRRRVFIIPFPFCKVVFCPLDLLGSAYFMASAFGLGPMEKAAEAGLSFNVAFCGSVLLFTTALAGLYFAYAVYTARQQKYFQREQSDDGQQLYY